MFKKGLSLFVFLLISSSLNAGILSFISDVLDGYGDEPELEQVRFYRKLYIKLPLDSVEYHWEFSDRKQVLREELVIKFTSEGRFIEEVIFSGGKLSDNWEVVSEKDSEDEKENIIYFGFQSRAKYWFDNDDSARITLINTEPLEGRGHDFTGVLGAGKHQSNSKNISLYEDDIYDTPEELEDAKAFYSIENWNEKWKFSSRTAQGTGWGSD